MVSIIIDTYVNISTVKYKAATPGDSSSDKGESHHDTNSNLKDSVVEDEESDVDFEVAEDPDIEVDGSGGDKCEKSPKKDDVFRYACELLTLGLIFNEYSDAIKEGDGKRVFRCFKYMLPLFKASNRVNYSCEMFCTLAQHKFILSPRLAHQLQWSRFVNTHGKKGKNIPCDLHMEHLNRIVKNGIHGLGANKAEKAMVRVGKCVDSISDVLTTYDDELGINAPSGQHTIASQQKDLDLVIQELTTRVNPFIKVPGRRHRHVNIPKTTLLQSLDEEKFSKWLNGKWCALLAGLI